MIHDAKLSKSTLKLRSYQRTKLYGHPCKSVEGQGKDCLQIGKTDNNKKVLVFDPHMLCFTSGFTEGKLRIPATTPVSGVA